VLGNYLIIALRNIKRHKLYSAINLIGLVIGLASFILILLYLQYEFSFDKHHDNADRIYRVATEFHGHDHEGNNFMAFTRGPLAPALLAEFPEVQAAARIKPASDIKLVVEETGFYEEKIYFADPAIFQIFTLPITRGNVDGAIRDPFTVVLSEKTARKYFGDVNPVGRTIRYMGNYDFRVIAVMQDMPQNSHFVMNLVFPLAAYQKINEYDLSDWRRSSCYTYLLLSESADPANLGGKLPALVKKYDTSAHSEKHTRHSSNLFLQPLNRIHLYSQLSGELAANNDIKNIYLFASIALLILLSILFLSTSYSMKQVYDTRT